jgi:predicted ATPase/transcriptional regulator with XRE-family HTH domain
MSEGITFGRWVKERRKERGVTQEELAGRIDCSLFTLQKIESGERRPSGQIANLLADYFRIPEDEREAFVVFARTGRAKSVPAAVADATEQDEAALRAPWRAIYVHKTNLPIALTPLIGRDEDVAAVHDHLLHPKTRLLTLTGPPGIGKTKLALQVAASLVEHFEDGVYFVDLSPLSDPELVPPTVARALGLQGAADRPPDQVLFDHVRDKRILLVLDNFEQVLDAGTGVVRLVETSPWLKVLITSREALHVRGERRYQVPALGIPDLNNLPPIQALSEYPSVELFTERAQEADHDFTLTEENAENVAALCVGLDGLPLAIELAASRAEHLSPAEMRAGLASGLRLLTGGARDLPARQRTVQAAIEWSYNLLEEGERGLFRRLGVFMGGFTPEAAEAVCSKESGLSLTGLLASLADKNLIRRERRDVAERGRYQFLETLREFASERLEESEEAEEVKREHALHFMRLAEEAEPQLFGIEQAMWLDRLEREHANIRAALLWAASNAARGLRNEGSRSGEAAEIRLRIAGALGRFWFLRGYYNEGREELSSALELSTTPTLIRSPFKAKALSAAGMLVVVQGDNILGRSLHEQSLEIRREIGDKRGMGISLNHLGTMAYERGDFASARLLFEQGLEIRREIGDKSGTSLMLTNLGTTLQQLGDFDAARSLLEESLALKREFGNKEGIANVLNNLGTMAIEQREYTRARALLEESLAVKREVGTKRGIAKSLSNLGYLAYLEGDYTTARSSFVESLTIEKEIGDNISIPEGLAGMGAVAAAIGEPQRGVKLLGAATSLWEAMGLAPDTQNRVMCDQGIASARSHLDEGAFAEAWAWGQTISIEEAVEYALSDEERSRSPD